MGGTTENSYATGDVNGGGGTNRAGGLIGQAGVSLTSTYYFVAGTSTDGVGNWIPGESCTGACTQTANLQDIFNALFNPASTMAPLGMGWSTMEWSDRSSDHPCVPDIDFGPGNGCP